MEPMSNQRKRIVTAAASIAVAGAFGAGAIALGQIDSSFDPSEFMSSYSQGADGAKQGYRAAPTQSGGDANRSGEDAEGSDAKKAETDHVAHDAINDAVENAPTGTTAYNLTGGDTQTGRSVVSAAGGNANGGSNSSGDDGSTATGPVINAVQGGGSGSGGANGGNSGADDGTTPEPEPAPDPTPEPEPAPEPEPNSYDLLPTDPDPEKVDPSGGGITFIPASDTSNIDPADVDVTIIQSLSDEYALYTGQKLDEWSIFCALTTTYGSSGQAYQWTCTKDQFATYPYFRVVDFPETAGDDPFDITVQYRFSTDGAWQTEVLTYTPQKSCTFLISGSNDPAGNPIVVASSYDDPVNLLSPRMQEALMNSCGLIDDSTGYLTRLLTGMAENGYAVPWMYAVTPGRHVIGPASFTELDPGYHVRLQAYYLDDDCRHTDSSGRVCSLQTLVDVEDSVVVIDEEDGSYTLSVPAGVQAVASRKTSEVPTSYTYSVSNMLLPASVLYYEPEGAFEVWDDYYVNPDNPNYASTKEGILTSKDGSEYVGVPLSRKKLDVPAGVKSITLSGLNQLDQITVAAADADNLPAIDLSKLNSCNITLSDDALIPYIEQNYQQLASSYDVTVSSADAPEVRYTCSGGMVFSDEQLLRVVNTGSSATFVQEPHTLESGCFEGCTDVDTVVLFDEGNFTLEDGCFTGGNVSTVVCFTDEQAAYVQSRLEAAGAPDAQVILPAESEEGFIYYEQNGKVYLLSSQDSVESFTGTLTDDDGTVRTIDAVLPYAFSDSYALKWVNLPDGVSSIGAKAFANCANLQGVFFGGEGDMAVGANAFEGCASLGFVASNARSLTFATQEVPNEDCVWYCPADATGGYDSRFTQFNDIERLSVAAQDDGSLVLCGSSAEGVPFIALGSGTSYEGGTLVLPSTVETIYRDAFANLGGAWQVDWSGMDALSYIGSGAFRESGISGAAVIDAHGGDLAIGSGAFSGCAQLTSLSVENAFSLDVGNEAFAGCTALERVTLGTLAETEGNAGNLGTNMFASCPAFKLLKFTSSTPLQPNLYSPGIAWSLGETEGITDAETSVRIEVPTGSEEAYLSSWVYALVGYANYDDYFAEVQFSLLEETFEMPSDAEMRAKMAENLLAPENQLRKLLGLPEVDASTVIVETAFTVDGFTFDSGDGTGPVG